MLRSEVRGCSALARVLALILLLLISNDFVLSVRFVLVPWDGTNQKWDQGR